MVQILRGGLLFHFEDVLAGAILHHPMVPRRGIELPDLTGCNVFIGAGTNDPMCPPEESEELMELLTNANADVTRSEEHTSELQSRGHLVCRLLLEEKKKKMI